MSEPQVSPRVIELAGHVLAGSRTSGRPARDVLTHELPRELAPAWRAMVARAVHEATQWRRTLTFVFGGALDHAQMTMPERELAMAMGGLLLAGVVGRDAAAGLWHQLSRKRVPWHDLDGLEAAVAAIDDPVVRLATRWSVPDWLAERLLRDHGEGAAGLLAALNAPAPRTIRNNPLRGGDRERLRADLQQVRVESTPTRYSAQGLHVHGDANLFGLPLFQAGRFEQQDEGSQLCAEVVAPPPRGKVLDLCAGSGGKTLALAAALQNRGELLAVDASERRLEALRQRARRAGADNVRAIAGDAVSEWGPELAAFASRADRMLLDVPCSGTGSWRRRPEARWNLQPADLDNLLAAQRGLLDRALAALVPGARAIYCTCSLLRDENEAQVEAALQRHAGTEVVRVSEVLGGARARPISDAGGSFLVLRPDVHGTDGFFAAVLRRRR